MQTTYAQKNDTVQKASANTVQSVVDSAAQIPIQNKKDRFDFNGLVFTYSQLSYLQNGYYFENGSYILNVRGVPIRIHVLQNINRQQAINMVQNTNGLSKSRRDEITPSLMANGNQQL